MTKMMRILLLLGLVVSLCASAQAGEIETSSPSFLLGVSTLSQTAVFAAFLSSIDGGHSGDAAISVSNVLAHPGGFPFDDNYSGKDVRGGLSFFLFDNGCKGEGPCEPVRYRFDTVNNPTVGTGLDGDGQLGPGGTYTVGLSEILQALFPDEPHDFNGYAWIVGYFDAITGTYSNFFPLIGASQSFVLQPAPNWIPVDLDAGLNQDN